MSLESLPTYPDLFGLSSEKILEIENICHKRKHLDLNEKLLDRIEEDVSFLTHAGLHKTDIYNNHRNMYMKFWNMQTNETLEQDYINDFIEELPESFGNKWCLHSIATNDILLNDQHLRITCLEWNGAEQCPIETYFSDKYHGYERGCSDWFIKNLDKNISIWVPDLLPAQMSMFGFCQSPMSVYRLDLVKYIQVMNINKHIELLPTVKSGIWASPSGSYSIDFVRTLDIIDEINNDEYHAILIQDMHMSLFIHFHDANDVRANKEKILRVFECDLRVGNIFNSDGYIGFRKKKKISLVT